jgi:hypothetical protein
MKLEQIANSGRLMKITRRMKLRHREPGKVVRVVSADPLGDNAFTVVYKADDGRLGERVLFRSQRIEAAHRIKSGALGASMRTAPTSSSRPRPTGSTSRTCSIP